MQMLVNCTYIAGNLHETMRVKYSSSQLSNFSTKVFGLLEKLCREYPMYWESLSLMVWYLRVCLLV